MDVEIDGERAGRIVFGLFGGVAPKAVENFLTLCRCDAGKKAKLTGKELCYRGSKIHRSVPNFLIQGGDFTHNDGTGGESIYGEGFEDGEFVVRHNRSYMLSMANDGVRKKSYRSQWFVNTVKTQWLDGKNEIFGMVLQGKAVITKIERFGTNSGTPKVEVVVADSGALEATEEDATPRLVSVKLQD